jgi:hypothetical protein
LKALAMKNPILANQIEFLTQSNLLDEEFVQNLDEDAIKSILDLAGWNYTQSRFVAKSLVKIIKEFFD